MPVDAPGSDERRLRDQDDKPGGDNDTMEQKERFLGGMQLHPFREPRTQEESAAKSEQDRTEDDEDEGAPSVVQG